jgi:alpha-D-ribose 1-methylphosphonate 5-triphosphate synthase subunit PhnG
MPDALDQSTYLAVLARSPAGAVKQFAEELMPELGAIDVLANRTGLVMVPMEETAQGAAFYLGEVLVAEAHVRAAGAEGYAACLGRDLEQALAIALIDAAVAGGVARARIAAFVSDQAAALDAAEQELLRQVAATRVEMETF